MNPESLNDDRDNLLDRSLNAMRSAPAPDGPAAKVLADTLAALRGAADESSNLKIKRFTNMKFITRFAASILLFGGIAALVFFSLHPSVALADVVKKVREAKTISFTTRVEAPGLKDQGATRFLMDNAGHIRMEQPTGMIVTVDSASGKSLMIEPKTKTAMVMNIQNGTHMAGGLADPIAEIKKLADKPSKLLGAKQLDGRKVKGFVVQEGSQEVTLWADAQSGDPVRIEIEMPLMGQKATVVMSDFGLDTPVDASTFSLEPPKDYHLRQVQLPKVLGNGEKNLIEALRGFAQRAAGRFPDRIDQWNEFAALASGDPNHAGAATTQWMSHVGAMTPFLMSLPKDEYAYLGSGVKLNQKDTIIFWYQNQETKKYRAIYADLTAKDVEDRKELPKADVKPAPPTPVPAATTK
jgi:outer membrane lipoprotein-sorting protein